MSESPPISSFSSLSLLNPPSESPLHPVFPTEIERHILAFASTGTLATCCRVSFEFLEIASEFLYKDVEIVGPYPLERLFCGRKPGLSSAQLEAPLSLNRVRRLTFRSIVFWNPSSTGISLEQVRFNSPLLLDELVLNFIATGAKVTLSNMGYRPTHRVVADELFPLLNPTSVQFAPIPPLLNPVSNLLQQMMFPRTWTRLKHLHVHRPRFFPVLHTSMSPSERWTVSYYVSIPTPTQDLGSIFDSLFIPLGVDGAFPDEKVDHAEIVVESEEQRMDLKGLMERTVPKGLGEDGGKERMKHISIVVRKTSA